MCFVRLTHLLKLEKLAVSLEFTPSGVQLVITGRQRSVQRLLVAKLGGEGGVLRLSAFRENVVSIPQA